MNYLVYLLFLTDVLAHHYFKCGQSACLTYSQVCYKRECVQKCDIDSDCESGNICEQRYKVWCYF